MQLQYRPFTHVSRPRFGKGLSIDIGASSGGSLKLQETDNDGNPTGSHKSTGLKPFADEPAFVPEVINQVDAFYPAHGKYDRIVVFAPGPAGQE